jgi:mono/diheme cytochrome c family protein
MSGLDAKLRARRPLDGKLPRNRLRRAHGVSSASQLAARPTIHRTVSAWAALGALMLCAIPAQAQLADPERGRALYENHCTACHTANVHTRPNRIALTRDEVRQIVRHWQAQQNLNWSAQDTEDVVEFLGRSRYRFPAGSGKIGRR